MSGHGHGRGCGRDRGQLVLVAAGVVAVALLACLLAYLQVAAPAAASARSPTTDVDGVVRGLHAAVGNASATVSGTVEDRDAAASRVEATLPPDVRAVEDAAAASGAAVRVRRNVTAADDWAQARCPGGDDRAFGDCVVRNGAVFQERADRAHLVAVGFDVRVADGRRRVRLTVVVRPVRGAVVA